MLRPRRERPCSRHAANERDELAPFQFTGLHRLTLARATDCMSVPFELRLTLDAVARVTRTGRAEPQARRVSHDEA